MSRFVFIAMVTIVAGCCPHQNTRHAESHAMRMPAESGGDDFLEQYAATFRFRLGRPGSIEVTPGGDAVLFLRSPARDFKRDLYEFNLETGRERVLLTAEQILQGSAEELSDREKARRERMRLLTRGISRYELSKDGSKILVPLSGRLFMVERKSGKVKELESRAGYPIDPRISPDGMLVGVVRDGDLYVIDVATGSERRLTTREGDKVSNGLSEFAAQEEMGRYRGFWWSPDSKYVAYQRTDDSALETMHIMDPLHPEKAPKTWSYPRAGKNNSDVRLGLIPALGGGTVWVNWDRKAYPYLATVKWPENAPLTVVVQNREQTEELVLTVDISTGKTRKLFREKDPAWLNIDQDVPCWLKSGKSFLWSSERNGAWQLELHDRNGKLLGEVTKKNLGYRHLVEVDEQAGVALVLAGSDPTERHLYRVRLDPKKGPPERLSREPGWHDAVWGVKPGVYVHTRLTLAGEYQSLVKKNDGMLIGEIGCLSEKPPFVPKLQIMEVQAAERTYKAALVRPRDFDPRRKYPVFVSVYAGPGHNQVIAATFPYLIEQWFADHGFVVVSLDGRGTQGRGREWERAIKGNFIDVALNDQVEGLKALGRMLPELDLDRVGIFGWSFGGYFSAMAVMLRPDVYHVGVAVAPVTDWLYYDTHYTERYLGLPGKFPEAYRKSSVLEVADRLTRPLLVIHGSSDDNVYFTHSLKLIETLFLAGKACDFLPLSGLTHLVPDPLVTRRLYTRIIDYVQANL